jgi:Spy/CpxP family protein refolding chaperone
MRRLSAVLCVVLLCVGLCSAQRRGGAGRGARAGSGVGEERTVLLFYALLSLTDAQRQHVKAILDEALEQAEPIVQQIDADKDGLFEAAKSGKNAEEFGVIATQQTSRAIPMMVLQAQTFSKIYAILNKDQQAKVDSFLYEQVAELLVSGQLPTPTTPAPPKP